MKKKKKYFLRTAVASWCSQNSFQTLVEDKERCCLTQRATSPHLPLLYTLGQFILNIYSPCIRTSTDKLSQGFSVVVFVFFLQKGKKKSHSRQIRKEKDRGEIKELIEQDKKGQNKKLQLHWSKSNERQTYKLCDSDAGGFSPDWLVLTLMVAYWGASELNSVTKLTAWISKVYCTRANRLETWTRLSVRPTWRGSNCTLSPQRTHVPADLVGHSLQMTLKKTSLRPPKSLGRRQVRSTLEPTIS